MGWENQGELEGVVTNVYDPMTLYKYNILKE